MDVTDDHGEEPSCAAERREEEAWFAANLGGLLGILTARERFVIELRFGLYCDPLLLDEVGEILGVTKERVRQIENRAIKRIRILAERSFPDSLRNLLEARGR